MPGRMVEAYDLEQFRGMAKCFSLCKDCCDEPKVAKTIKISARTGPNEGKFDATVGEIKRMVSHRYRVGKS
jgi:hypothetical protein